MGRATIIDKLTIKLKKELTNPKLSAVKKTYIMEKLKILGEFMVKK